MIKQLGDKNRFLLVILRFKFIQQLFIFLMIPIRFIIGFHYVKRPIFSFFKWLFYSKELTNFTYDLTDSNKKDLAAVISVVTHVKEQKITEYIKEIDENKKLRKFISMKIKTSIYRFQADEKTNFCRRIGWYAFIRALKPAVVVETGVDKGMGAVVIAEALKKNSIEGKKGIYYGFDNMLSAGYLFDDPYNRFGQIIYGDSVTSLRKFSENIDIFINDSDHSPEYEAKEYQTILNKLSKNGVILGDNSHATNELHKFSTKYGRKFIFWGEKPKNHWYPGAGIGISFPDYD